MMLMKVIFLYSIVSVVNSKGTKIPESFESGQSRISDIKLVQLLELCFFDRLNPVVVTSDLTGIINEIHRKSDQLNTSLFIIGTRSSSSGIEEYGAEQKFNGFNSYPTYILSASSLDVLKSAVLDIQKWDPWTNSRIIFTVGNQCNNAVKSLHYIWESRGLSSFFICPSKRNNKTLMYTFNPYEKKAPKPWKSVEDKDKPPHPWTLYKMLLNNDKSICSNITFNKSDTSKSFQLRISQDGVFLDHTNPFFRELLTAGNTTSLDYNTSQVKLKTITPEYDIILPFSHQEGFIIITQKHSTSLSISFKFFTFTNLITFSIILLVTSATILLNRQYHFVTATVDFLLLILNIGVLTPMNRLWLRITLISLTLFVITLNPSLQGQLAFMLTQPASNIETLRDLRDNNYHIFYSSENITAELQNSGLWNDDSFTKYIHFLDEDKQDYCLKAVENNSSIACLVDFNSFDEIDLTINSYISSGTLTKKLSVFIPHEWSLSKRENEIATKLLETGQLDYFEKQILYKSLMNRKKLNAKIKAINKLNQNYSDDYKLLNITIMLITVWGLVIIGIEKLLRKVESFLDERFQELEVEALIIKKKLALTVKKINIIVDKD